MQLFSFKMDLGSLNLRFSIGVDDGVSNKESGRPEQDGSAVRLSDLPKLELGHL